MKKLLLFTILVLFLYAFIEFILPEITAVKYLSSVASKIETVKENIQDKEDDKGDKKEEDSSPKTAHITPPEPMKAIYMSACVAGTPSLRNNLVKLIDETELNAVVIDIKDYSGRISFAPTSEWDEYLSPICKVSDMKEFLDELHAKGIYRIGRVTVFQDPYYTNKHPELAVKKMSDKSVTWKDYKGLSFLDAGARGGWEHITKLAKDSHAAGFDEINFDYIRFPSDGNMKDIYFPHSDGKNKSEVLESFFSYLSNELKPLGVVMSADIFGMTTTNTDDLNIGQVLEKALPYFDYVAPMVYPSHYPKGFMNFQNPNDHVYEVVNHSMSVAVKRAESKTSAVKTIGSERIGTSTPALYTHTPQSKLKLRPWLQDFDYGGDYDIPEVKGQIKATYDAGLTSWFLWSPSNRYTRGALLSE